MSSILNQIVQERRESLVALMEHYPEATILAQAHRSKRPIRSLYQALAGDQTSFILECKRASPSKGLIRPDFDPVAIARIYQSYGAAISVLTEPQRFQGSFSYLQAVSTQVHCPVICKDFIVTPYQVALARYFGADAILLMLSVLSDQEYRKLAGLARELGLEILTEVSTPTEMQRARALEARIIGINHRNLHDLTIDLNRSRELARLAPAGAILIAESGLTEHRQVRELSQYVQGFLVGSHLTAQPDIDQACRQLIFGPHKVCGLTRSDQALQARAAGACYGGLIFAQRSPRRVSLARARHIMAAAPGLAYVGVCTVHDTTDPVATIAALARELKLSAVQLHDQPAPELLHQLRSELPAHTELWLALAVDQPLRELPELPVDRFVLDHGAGGTGTRFDWSWLPARGRDRCLLAGGIGPENMTEALVQGCSGVDMNSALEVAPGEKDPARVHQALHIIRTY